MESKIFGCVIRDDVEALKPLMNYPIFFQIEDVHGDTILEKSIGLNSIAVFDFLLSVDGCPINARNSGGRTALDVAYNIYTYERTGQHFIYSLLKKGADNDAIDLNHINLAKIVIEKGADLNSFIMRIIITHLYIMLNSLRVIGMKC